MRLFPCAVLACAVALPAHAADKLPFEGTWDCEVAVFTFTAQTYDNGSEVMDILDIAQDGTVHALTFENDYQLFLEVNADGTMTWFSPASGDSFLCRPLP